jgi:hypothetical protein
MVHCRFSESGVTQRRRIVDYDYDHPGTDQEIYVPGFPILCGSCRRAVGSFLSCLSYHLLLCKSGSMGPLPRVKLGKDTRK